MLDKVKKFFDNPYYAPLTQPLRNVASITLAPLDDMIEAFRDGYDKRYDRYDSDNSPRLMRAFGKANDSYGHTQFIMGAGHVLGGIAAGVAGGFGGFGLVASAGIAAKIGVTAFGAVAAASLGVIAGPFVVAGIVAMAAFTVGVAIGVVPGIFKGVGKAFEHHKLVKAGQILAAQLPPEKSKDEQLVETLSPLMATFNALKPEEQGPFVKMMNENFLRWSGGGAEKIKKLVEVLPEPERVALAETLRGILKDAFEKSVQEKADRVKAATLAPSDPEGDDPIVAPERARFRRPLPAA